MMRRESPAFESSKDGHTQMTGPRFNLSNPIINSSDIIVSYPDAQLRLIQYPFDRSKHKIFEALMAKKLILGSYLQNVSETQVVFSTPADARPLKFEVGTMRQGEFTYGDQRLFKELGGLLGITTKATGGLVLPIGEISMSVAFVDFTRPEEHNLFLIPGAERLLEPTEMSPRDYYMQGLAQADEMGSRFHTMAAYEFSRNFENVTSGNS